MSCLPISLQNTENSELLCCAISTTQLNLVWESDERLETGISFVSRLRGAWGRELASMADTSDDAFLALSAFFPDKVYGKSRFGAPPPYRIVAWRGIDQTLNMQLKLIGFAGRWRRVAFDAFVNALASPPGLRVDYNSKIMTDLKLRRADWTRHEGVSIPESGGKLVLDFHTPLRIGADTVLSSNFGNVILSVAERAIALSPWLGLTYRADLSRLRDVANATNFNADEMQPATWETWSTANGRDKGAGYLGKLIIAAPTDEVIALLSAGTVLHAGGKPSKGFGHYQLFVEP